MSDRMSGKHFTKDFYLSFENNILSGILSGNLSVGLAKNICLPDRMSGKNLNTFFANTDFLCVREPASVKGEGP